MMLRENFSMVIPQDFNTIRRNKLDQKLNQLISDNSTGHHQFYVGILNHIVKFVPINLILS